MLNMFERGPGWRSRYSDSPVAGRSGDRISVGAKYSADFRTDSEVYPASCTVGIESLSRGNTTGAWTASRAEAKEEVELQL